MHSKSDDIEFMIYDNADEVVKDLFESLLSGYQIGLGTSMGGSDLFLYCVYLLYYKCHKTNLNCGGSNMNSPDWIKNKKTINFISKNDNKSFQYVVTFALNHKKLENILKE